MKRPLMYLFRLSGRDLILSGSDCATVLHRARVSYPGSVWIGIQTATVAGCCHEYRSAADFRDRGIDTRPKTI